MPTAYPIFGTYTQLGIGTASPVDTRLDFQRSTYGVTQQLPDFSGMRGVRSRDVSKVRESTKDASGDVDLIPTFKELSYILPWILGANASGTTFALADQLQSRYMTIDYVEKVIEYAGVYVNRARFSARPGDALRCSLNLAGTTDAIGNAGTFPALSFDVTTKPLMLHDSEGAVLVGGVAYKTAMVEWEIDNVLNLDRYLNSISRTGVSSTDRIVRVSLSLPLNESYAAFNTGAAGVAVSFTFTYGTTSLAVTFPKVVFQRRDPQINGRNEELMVDLTSGEAKKDGSNLEVVHVLDSTP